MIFNCTDRAFLDGDIIVKVENTNEARYLIGIALIAGKETEFTDPWDYDCYPYFVIEKDELVAYVEIPNKKHLTLVTYKDFAHNDLLNIKKTDRGSLVADSTCQ